MKITVFSQHFWPENFRINDIIFHLARKGAEINVFTGKPNYHGGYIQRKYKGFKPKIERIKKVEILRYPIVPRGNASFLRLTINYLSYIISLTTLPFFYKKKFGDIFFVYATSPIFQAIPALIFGKLFKKPVVLWVQDLWPHNLIDTGYINNKTIIKIINYFVIKIYDLSSLILCQSDDFYREIKKKTKTKVEILYNPSNFEFQRKRKFIKKKYFDFYYTGNLGKGQNVTDIIKIFAEKKIYEKGIRFIIYGAGKEFNLIKKKIKNNKYHNIFLHKPIPPYKLKKKMKNAYAFILKLNNGHGLSKTIPAKFQTYLSFGKPIISINNGITTKIIKQNKIGFTCGVKEFKNLSKIIIKTKNLKSNKLNEIFGNSEIIFKKYFDINISCKKLKNYLEAVL